MSTIILAFQTSKTFYMKYYADQCLNDGRASVIVGAGAWPPPKGGRREGRWSPGKGLGFSCILDTFYDNVKATDLVYFIS